MGKQVQLSGKATLQFDTIKGTCKIEVPKQNRDGENNADSLIREVLHFGVMRHGKEKLRELFEEKLAEYGDEYQSKGLSYE